MAITYIDRIMTLKADFEEKERSGNDDETLKALFELSYALVDKGRPEEASKYLIRGKEIVQKSRTMDNYERIAVLSYISENLSDMEMEDPELQTKNLFMAVEISNLAASMALEYFPDDHELFCGRLLQSVDILGMAGCTEKAVSISRDIVKLIRMNLGENHEIEANLKLSLGRNYLMNGNPRKAQEALSESLDIALKSKDPSPSLISDIYLFQSNAFLVQGNEIAASRCAELAYSYLEDYEWDDKIRVGILLDLSTIYDQLGMLQKAGGVLSEVIEIEEALGFSSLEIEKHRKMLEEIQRKKEER